MPRYADCNHRCNKCGGRYHKYNGRYNKFNGRFTNHNSRYDRRYSSRHCIILDTIGSIVDVGLGMIVAIMVIYTYNSRYIGYNGGYNGRYNSGYTRYNSRYNSHSRYNRGIITLEV